MTMNPRSKLVYNNRMGFSSGECPFNNRFKYLMLNCTENGALTTLNQIGEALPLSDSFVDVVIGTLVLCSVEDVRGTLREVRKVLKPGGMYLFVELVGAQDGTFLRNMQNFIDPLQQTLADGCHLTRDTTKYIVEAGFVKVDSNTTVVPVTSFG